MAETLISPGILSRENDISFIQPAPLEGGAAFIGPAVKGPVEVPTTITSYGQYQRVFGTTFESGSGKFEHLTSIAVKSYFEQGGATALITRVVSGSFTSATSTHVSASAKDSTQPFTLESLGKGVIYNTSLSSTDPGSQNSDSSLVSGSSDNLRWEISNIDNSKGTFSLIVRRGDDSLKNKIVLETFNDLSLDENSENYIEKVIGNQSISKSTDGSGNVYVAVSGDYVNKSNYVRVASVNLGTLDYLGTDGITVRDDSSSTSYSASLPIAQSGSFQGATGTNFNSSRVGNFFDNIDSTDIQGLVPANYNDAISILGNQDEYLFNIISAPGLNHNQHSTQVNSIISLAEDRGDCIAVVDLYQYGGTVSNLTSAASSVNSSYGAAYWPWVQVQSETGKLAWVPASTVIPGVFAFTDGANAPWFAPAGLVRGGIPNVIQAERKLSRTDRDSLYKSNVNPIATFPGTGIAVFGQKTLQKKSSALDRVNVRRLLIDLKKFIGDQAKNLVFEQNTITTRNRFLAAVNPYLESVVQRQGLYAYRVLMDDSNNSADVIDRNQLVGQIFIQPAKTVEFVVLDFVVEPTGATFNV